VRARDSQSTDILYRRCLVAAKSEVDVGYIDIESESLRSTDLVIHKGVANIFQYTVKFPFILGFVWGVRGVTAGCH